MKPCKSCPFRPDSMPGLWHPAHYLLIAYLGSVAEFTSPTVVGRTMGCHQFNGRVRENTTGHVPRCGGWVRAAPHSFALRMSVALGSWSREELAELTDGAEVMSPEEMARVNGLDMSRIPPLTWSADDARYPTHASWVDAVNDLRRKLEADPEYARTFVVPGSPLDIGVTDEDIAVALGATAASTSRRAREPVPVLPR